MMSGNQTNDSDGHPDYDNRPEYYKRVNNHVSNRIVLLVPARSR